MEWGEQTGWAAKQDGLRGVDGAPSLAAQVAAYLETAGGEGSESGWVALLKADNGRFALVRVREGTIGTDGDEVFGDAGTALQSVAAARAEGAEVYGTAGTVTDGSLVVEIDPAVLPDADRRGGLSRGGGGVSASRAVLLSGALLLLVAGGAAAIAPDALFGLLGGGREAAVNVLPQRDPQVSARIDSAALVAACGAALADRPPYMPAWRISGIECHGRFEELELVGLRPELQGRAVMVVRWELQGEYVAALHRRIAEEHLSAWYVASVVGEERLGGGSAAPGAGPRRGRAAAVLSGVPPRGGPASRHAGRADRLRRGVRCRGGQGRPGPRAEPDRRDRGRDSRLRGWCRSRAAAAGTGC